MKVHIISFKEILLPFCVTSICIQNSLNSLRHPIYPNPADRKIRIRAGEELEEKTLKPSFKSGRTSIGVYAAIIKGGRTELILVRKRKEEERTIKKDRLGLNSHQYATEIHQPYLIPFIEGLDRPSNEIHLAADNAPWYGGAENRKLMVDCGYKKTALATQLTRS